MRPTFGARWESISEDARANWLLCWQLLDDLDRRKVLSEIVDEAIFDPKRGKVTVEINDDADLRLLEFGVREYGS